MTELILHSYLRCPFAIRVRMVLEEKNLKYQVIEENLSNLSDTLLKLHPEGRVPLLIHRNHVGTHVIYESSIISEYLEDAFPAISLMPKTAEGRAEMRLWTYWCNAVFKPDLDLLKYEWQNLEPTDQQSLILRLKEHLNKMASPLHAQPFLQGQELGLSDIHLFPFYRQIKKAHPDFDRLLEGAPLTILDSWLTKITERPSFERVMNPT